MAPEPGEKVLRLILGVNAAVFARPEVYKAPPHERRATFQSRHVRITGPSYRLHADSPSIR